MTRQIRLSGHPGCALAIGGLRGLVRSPAAAAHASRPDLQTAMRRSAGLLQRAGKSLAVGPGARCAASETGIVSGVPEDTYARKVVIYTPARTPTQQGRSKTLEGNYPAWRIEFSTKQKWENPLMGWTSTADPLEHVGRSGMWFWTQQEAEHFCSSHGYEYEVQQPNIRSTTRGKRYASYGNNFSTQRGGVPKGGLRSEQKDEDPSTPTPQP